VYILISVYCSDSKCYFEPMSRGISYMKYENGRLTSLVTPYVEIAFYNVLFMGR